MPGIIGYWLWHNGLNRGNGLGWLLHGNIKGCLVGRSLLQRGQSQLLQGKRCYVHAHNRIYIRTGMTVSIEDETVTLFDSDFQNHVVQFLFHLGHQVLLGLFEQFYHLHTEVHAVVHKVLEFGLALLHDGLGKVFLSLKEFDKLALEFLLATHCFFFILLFQLVEILLRFGIFGHLLHHLLIAQIAKLDLCHCRERQNEE